MNDDNRAGIISIEAAIGITLFLFAILFFYAMFYVTLARNLISHALLQTSQSMALDAYESNKFTADSNASWNANDVSQLLNNWLGIAGANNGYVDSSRWYEGSVGNLAGVIRHRFASYLSGGESQTNERLKALGVEDGLDGMNFSGSYVKGGDLYIILKYEIEPWINFFHVTPIQMTLQARAKLWGTGSVNTTAPGSQGGGFR